MIIPLSQIAGGLSLFIYGMQVTNQGLRAAAGSSLRTILSRSAGNPLRGVLTGTALGFLTHSGTATIMTVGFVNAGLIPLAAALAPIYGANIGTALAMQLFSFNITPFSWLAIATGYILKVLMPQPRQKEAGMAIAGFGLILLGMSTISSGVMPYRETLAPLLAHIRGDTMITRLAGIAIASVLSALLTSSGAVIGLCFSLMSAGLLTSFDAFFPVVAGARVGTCIVTLVAAISMNNEARRTAASHLLFNLFNVVFALLLYPLFKSITLWSADEPVRQAANLHLLMMFLPALPLLPLSKSIAQLLRIIIAPGSELPEPSYLRTELLHKPEQAIFATINETRRIAKLCTRTMTINGELMLHYRNDLHRNLKSNERIINEIRDATGDYLDQLTNFTLSARQTIFVQYLDRCMKDIERIGDYQEAIATITELRRKRPTHIPDDLFDAWFELFCTARKVLTVLEYSLNPEGESFNVKGKQLLDTRDAFSRKSAATKSQFAEAARKKLISGTAAYYLHRYQADLDRMMGHVRSIAVVLEQPEFNIQAAKLDQTEVPVTVSNASATLDTKAYRERLYAQPAKVAEEQNLTENTRLDCG